MALAERAGIGKATLVRIEEDIGHPSARVIKAVDRAFMSILEERALRELAPQASEQPHGDVTSDQCGESVTFRAVAG